MTLPLLGPSRSRSPSGRRAPVGAAALGALGLGGLALVALSASLDAWVAAAVADLPVEVKRLADNVSDLGRSGYMFALSVAAVLAGLALQRLDRGRTATEAAAALRERGGYVLAVLTVSGLLAQVVKHLVGRARPHLLAAFGPYHFDLLSLKASLASFPSGHATTVFAMAVALAPFTPRAGRALLLAAAVCVAAARVAIDAHYVSDVVAGGVLGALSALALARLFASWSVAFDRDAAAVRLRHGGAVTRFIRDGGVPR